ncbi:MULTISPECIES: hypothetical protein [unclassified Micromonospora]|uniref:hypothetical protein n=1 Tax=unclassified Micromonospora TaxID=2617518 RepID=UPI00331A8824
MSSLPALLHDSALGASIAAVLYAATVTTTALTALFARTPTRRRAAQTVLKILLRPRNDPE